MDYETDSAIQQTLRQSPAFQGKTLIVIAHRIHTVIDSDMIVVLSDGRVVEQGAPQVRGHVRWEGGLSDDHVLKRSLLKCAGPARETRFRLCIDGAGGPSRRGTMRAGRGFTCSRA